MPAPRGRKRGSTATPVANKGGADSQPAKRTKIYHRSHQKLSGTVLACGEGDVGQLGMGENILDRTKPGKVALPSPVIQAVAGGMHTVCLLENGEIYTFGCNDDGALGHDTSEDGSEMSPAKVENLGAKIIMVSAGDSHTAALADDGRVYIWGAFRDANGMMGMLAAGKTENTPVPILEDKTIVKIASGGDFLVCLSDAGEIFTLGCAEQGQLGRVAECFSQRGGRKGLDLILLPGEVHFKKSKGSKRKFSDIWVSTYSTYAQVADTNEIYAWGLNNYYQLGINDLSNRFVPTRVPSFDGKEWLSISGGQHHLVALDSEGKVYTLGRGTYGQLGLGEDVKAEIAKPTVNEKLNNKCVCIATGSAVSFAIDEQGICYGWGMGTSKQLAQTEDDDCFEPTILQGKQLENKKTIAVSSGGQHTVLLVTDK
ncbi:unnamed protein product [Owenia fusiformis]|uniref:RCC1-like domain-containing protein n=1 Tax=Owenia fusiformis TaxID=6347 RepID=A0A8J1Y002_OWEFU|nr:unnamed protein product [Owenia fusiformis]